MNRKKLIFNLGMLVFIVFSACVIRAAVLNAGGHCSKAGRVLSDGEKIRATVQYFLDKYPPSVIPIPIEIDGKVTRLSKPKNPVSYKNVDEFFVLNSHCCILTSMRSAEEGTPGFMQRITGTVSGFARIEYLVFYMDDVGVKRSVLSKNHTPISNCGKPTHFWFPEQNWFASHFGFDLADLFD